MIPTLLESGILAFFVFVGDKFRSLKLDNYKNF